MQKPPQVIPNVLVAARSVCHTLLSRHFRTLPHVSMVHVATLKAAPAENEHQEIVQQELLFFPTTCHPGRCEVTRELISKAKNLSQIFTLARGLMT